jgi:hypothetical protein
VFEYYHRIIILKHHIGNALNFRVRLKSKDRVHLKKNLHKITTQRKTAQIDHNSREPTAEELQNVPIRNTPNLPATPNYKTLKCASRTHLAFGPAGTDIFQPVALGIEQPPLDERAQQRVAREALDLVALAVLVDGGHLHDAMEPALRTCERKRLTPRKLRVVAAIAIDSRSNYK